MSKRILYALPMPRGEDEGASAHDGADGLVGRQMPADDRAAHRFEKELIREGTWVHPTKQFTFRVTPKRMQVWLKAFARMKAAGLKVPLPFGHSCDPRDNAGFLEDLRVEGNRLIGVLAVARAEDAERIGATIRDVSVCVNPNFVDAHGNRLGEVIEHVALTNYPMVEGQPNFAPVERIAAGDDDAEVWTFAIERVKEPKEPAPDASEMQGPPTAAGTARPDKTGRGTRDADATPPAAGTARPDKTGRGTRDADATPPAAGEAPDAAALRIELARERETRIAAEVASHVSAGRIPPAAAEAVHTLLTCQGARRFDLDTRSEVGLDIAATFRYLLSLLPPGAAVDVADRTRGLRPMPNPGNGRVAAGRATAAAARRMLESRGYAVTLSDDGTTILEANREI